jgi:hypothetical protein
MVESLSGLRARVVYGKSDRPRWKGYSRVMAEADKLFRAKKVRVISLSRHGKKIVVSLYQCLHR